MLQNVQYCVLGVGNSDWVNTFHRVPKLIDDAMSDMGAKRIFPTVLGNVAKDIIGAFDEFSETLWQSISKDKKPSAAGAEELKVEMTVERPEMLGEKEMRLATVHKHIQLADTSVGPEKRLMEIQMDEDVSYQTGDYCASIFPSLRQRHWLTCCTFLYSGCSAY
jgi:cytochrome P450 / NADPH-cytochrome P450 reductase